ncbi:FBP domain-containing protein [Herbiconiux sp. YIM B11900]|uniref:FBP domain-containing protein n=1 Tax=Herbiconiux sp. YIM B11900 TaxID=3404131 RepID=UPI003F8340CC
MHSLTEKDIRTSFVNASQRERGTLTLPAGFEALDWASRDFLGWRDPKLPAVGYVVGRVADDVVGVLLRQADGRIRTRPQCSWCEDVTLPNDVVLFSAKRAGAAGRNGNTVGVLACAGFECSANARRRPPLAYVGFDVEAARQQRVLAVQQHVESFLRTVREG